MKKGIILVCTLIILFLFLSFKKQHTVKDYEGLYFAKLNELEAAQVSLHKLINSIDITDEQGRKKIDTKIDECRMALKSIDFWLRYLEPVSYKQINGPLPVEWETEVFEKFEKPYKRPGAGLTLASLYLEEDNVVKDTLLKLIDGSIKAIKIFKEDSVTTTLKSFDHFYLCNRLFLLNLATIYTTGFECPKTEKVIHELEWMLLEVEKVYDQFNHSFGKRLISENYLAKFRSTINFVQLQSKDFERFDHFTFIKLYVNPLFAMNQQLIRDHKVVSKSYVDYSLNKNARSIFSKNLYHGQNEKGLFIRVFDKDVLAEVEKLGKMLFYDPILSGNNLRSCSSCHIPTQYFTDTINRSALQYDKKANLKRNTPTLLNAGYNHLLMLDGFHITLQNQAKAVVTNSLEMGAEEKDVLNKVLSCKEYKDAFKKLLKYTPQEKSITFEHISSALTLYYSKFGNYNSPFDEYMNDMVQAKEKVKAGFNLYMSKAQCATCHFAPQFNGVKPPYVGSEFEVLGVPKDEAYKELSSDRGRYEVNPAKETMNAFRTGTLRNSERTKPYMHNGVFNTMEKVIDFYDGGGGAGHGLIVENQTLSSDSLHLTQQEKKSLIEFINSLTEKIEFESVPEKLPVSKIKALNKRKVNGEY
jgi:cytochrome c peroxidase